MKLVVGLGNPGRKYDGTRHNIGFAVAVELARRHGDGNIKNKFHGEIIDANLDAERAVILTPHTFMNNSGKSVIAARDFYKLANDDVLVICDDLNLPPARIRVRASGSAGGQKGLADILRALGGDDVPRLRIGIGQPPGQWDATNYVLTRFKKDEAKEIEVTIQQAADAVLVWARDGIEKCMNEFN